MISAGQCTGSPVCCIRSCTRFWPACVCVPIQWLHSLRFDLDVLPRYLSPSQLNSSLHPFQESIAWDPSTRGKYAHFMARRSGFRYVVHQLPTGARWNAGAPFLFGAVLMGICTMVAFTINSKAAERGLQAETLPEFKRKSLLLASHIAPHALRSLRESIHRP